MNGTSEYTVNRSWFILAGIKGSQDNVC